jgi:membrane protein implicated in regulation of membrane protease activity
MLARGRGPALVLEYHHCEVSDPLAKGTPLAMTPRALLLFAGLTLLLAAAVASLATGNWWFLGAVLVLHAIAFAIAMLPVFRALGEGDEPDPLVRARLEEERQTAEAVRR